MAKGKYQDWLTDDGLLKITQWARLGLTNEQIAQNMNVGSRTFYTWLDKYKQIQQALKKGRETSIEILENSMFKKANGFYEDGRYFPPDNVSMIYLMKNWAADRYTDTPKPSYEIEKLELENRLKKAQAEQIELKNELLRQALSNEDEKDRLDDLIKAVDNATIIDAETVS